MVTRMSPSCVRLLYVYAVVGSFGSFVRKLSASIGRKSGSSTPVAFIAAKRVAADVGESWKLSVAMWQSPHERPLPPRPVSVRSWKFRLPRQNAELIGSFFTPVIGSQ